MSSLGSKFMVLLILLGQVVASLGLGQHRVMLPGTAAVAHAGHADEDECGHDAPPDCDHHSAVRLFPWTSDDLAGQECATRCCPCPHIHMQVKDAPLAAGEARGAKESVPSTSPATATPSIDDWRSHLNPRANWRWSVRHLEAEHPPPPGVSTTKLRL